MKLRNFKMTVIMNILESCNYFIDIYGMDILVSFSIFVSKPESKWHCKILNFEFTE